MPLSPPFLGEESFQCQLGPLQIGHPGLKKSCTLFTLWICSLLRHNHKLTAKIQLKLQVIISKYFSKGIIVSTIYWGKWNFVTWLGRHEQHVLGFEFGGKVSMFINGYSSCMLEHKIGGRERCGIKDIWGKFIKVFITTMMRNINLSVKVVVLELWCD